MKLREVLKIISIILNVNEGEKIYLSEKRGYLLKGGKIWSFYDDKNKQYEIYLYFDIFSLSHPLIICRFIKV